MDGLAHGLSSLCRGTPLLREIQELVGALVGSFWTPPPRQQTGDSLGLKRRVGFIKSLSADAERAGDIGDGSSLHAAPTKHLITDLDQVARIEKLVSSKVFVLDGFRVRMEGSLVAKSGCFGVSRLRRLMSRHICQ
jgi:hypothetical protein